MVYLDTSPVIYFVEQPPVWGVRATARITSLVASGERLALSDLTRMECRAGPLKANDRARLQDFDDFFALPDVQVFPLTSAVCDRAAQIRATYNFKPLDCLHLAAAVEDGCTLFLTNDTRLRQFSGLTVEVL